MPEDIEEFEHPVSEAIRSHAMAHPEAVEGTSCVNRAFSSRKKNFVFLGEKAGMCTVRLKLLDSIDQVRELAEARPDRFEVGVGGWTKLSFPADDPPAGEDLDRWITESFRLLAPKTVVKMLDR